MQGPQNWWEHWEPDSMCKGFYMLDQLSSIPLPCLLITNLIKELSNPCIILLILASRKQTVILQYAINDA